MADSVDGGEGSKDHKDLTAIQVAVRVRPINPRERAEGHRTCVDFDDATKQVVLTAVDRTTLMQLRGNAAKGYAFDRRYPQDTTSDTIYEDCVSSLVESCFKVLAYGQTGSGKTHTMSGGIGIHGKIEEGITPRVIRHMFAITDSLNKKAKPGEKVEISAYALELYNEDLLDLSQRSGRDDAGKAGAWDKGSGGTGSGATAGALKLQERPVGKEGRVVPEVVGVKEVKVKTADDLKKFYDDCMENRSTSSTKLNDRSSRSHAIFTISIHRTMIEVTNELGDDFKAKVRTQEFTSKLHLVDLAGSERVKRSGVTGKELKEATHINSGLLALGNVIVALSNEAETKKKGHVPYRDSKLTRLLQDSLGGNSLTVLISCISPSEMDFEETNNTLKYANRACHIKNTPLPNKFTTLEEDLLPSVPAAGGIGLVQLQALLEDHERMKETRERREKEKAEREARRQAALSALKEEQAKQKGFQRLRATQYDELRRQLAAKGAVNIPQGQSITDEVLKSFGRTRLTQSVDGFLTPQGGSQGGAAAAGGAVPGSASRARFVRTAGKPSTPSGRSNGIASSSVRVSSKPQNQSFQDWLAAQEKAESAPEGSESADITGGDEDGVTLEEDSFIVEDSEAEARALTGEDDLIIEDDEEQPGAFSAGGAAGDSEALDSGRATPSQQVVTKSKFRRGPQRPDLDSVAAMSHSESAASFGAGSMDVQAGTSEMEEGSTEGSAAVHAGTSTGGAAGAGEPTSTTDLQEGQLAEDAVGTPDRMEGGAGAELEVLEEEEEGPLEEEEEELPYDPIKDDETPKLLARFKVNMMDTLAVFKAVSKEDFKDVIGLLPENTPLPASDKMTYLLARLESGPNRDLGTSLARVAAGELSMNEAVGPAVGCLMATFGTNMISSCIFEFDDPQELKYFDVEERIELWGLQIPHNSVRPPLVEEGAAQEASTTGEEGSKEQGSIITWTSVDRLNMSIGLLYALCNHALDNSIKCGFCVPRPQLLKRWLQAGVRMRQITGNLKLIYPPSAHDYEYYKASTVAYFMVPEVREALEKVLGVLA